MTPEETPIPTLGTPVARLARRRLLAAAAALAVAGRAAAAVRHHAAAQPVAKPREEASPPAQSGSTSIDGFRSARFGMNEEEVHQAIRKDFPSAMASLARTANLSEKTTVLSVAADGVIADAPSARISYILGYSSKKLIQINVNWASDGDSESSDRSLVTTANELRDYFAAESFAPNSVVANRKLGNDAILVYRAADSAGHVVALILSGVTAAVRAAKKPPPPPLSLELAYIENSTHPDIFRLPKGLF